MTSATAQTSEPPHDLHLANNKDLVNSMAAMHRAAAMARRVAIQTDTAIIVRVNNKVVRRTAAELRAAAAAAPE